MFTSARLATPLDTTTTPSAPAQRTHVVADGTIAYDEVGAGPLVVMLPGIGDLRQAYRFLAPRIAAAGYRVVTVDLRGHGGSSARWPTYDASAQAQDVLALLDHLDGGPAVIVGNSFAASVAVWAATERPAAVAGTVLIGPFVRAPEPNPILALAIHVLFRAPWKVRVWIWYHGTLFPTAKPADHAAYRAALRANLAEPGRFGAVQRVLFRQDDGTEARLAQVRAPTLVLMGSKDPDFRDPKAEASWIADRTNGEVAVVPDAGHYPHAEMPDVSAARILPFLAWAHHRA